MLAPLISSLLLQIFFQLPAPDAAVAAEQPDRGGEEGRADPGAGGRARRPRLRQGHGRRHQEALRPTRGRRAARGESTLLTSRVARKIGTTMQKYWPTNVIYYIRSWP